MIKYFALLLTIFAILLFAVALLSGCAPLSATSTAAPDALVMYQRSGGFAGLDDQLTIYADGRAELRQHEQATAFTVTTEELSQLTALLDGIAFSSLAGNYPPPSQGADYLSYTIDYAGERISAVDTTIPEALYPLLDLLDQLIAQASNGR
ncbi:MAG TPA: hypothetical protein P5121_17360 [Caldilineaceae bacterium]|nr:hypothetical protein [Caldilineaceae bacterium]